MSNVTYGIDDSIGFRIATAPQADAYTIAQRLADLRLETLSVYAIGGNADPSSDESEFAPDKVKPTAPPTDPDALPPGCIGWRGGYVTTPRPVSDAARAELLALAAERGRGEVLDLDGDSMSYAYVVVRHPMHPSGRGRAALDIDPKRWPAIAAAQEIGWPDDSDDSAD